MAFGFDYDGLIFEYLKTQKPENSKCNFDFDDFLENVSSQSSKTSENLVFAENIYSLQIIVVCNMPSHCASKGGTADIKMRT